MNAAWARHDTEGPRCRTGLVPLIVAPFIGSFAALLIRRLPLEQPVALARSHCEACGHVLGPWELIPLLSAASPHALPLVPRAHPARACRGGACLSRGRRLVRSCWAPDTRSIWLDCVLGWSLLALAWIDWDHMLLPDVLTLPLILAGLGATLLLDPAATTDHAAAAAAGYLAFRGDRTRLSPAARTRRAWPGRRQAAGRRGRLARADGAADGDFHCRGRAAWCSRLACARRPDCTASPHPVRPPAVRRHLGHLAWLRSR